MTQMTLTKPKYKKSQSEISKSQAFKMLQAKCTSVLK